MNVIGGTGQVVAEPDWNLLFTDEMEIAAAHEHWRIVTTELRERQLLSPVNGHMIQRLVGAYILHDRSYRIVAEHGVMTKPKRGNTRAIARLSPHFTAMREAASDAAMLEGELGLSPRRRGAVTKVEQRKRQARAADEFTGKASG